MSRHRNIAIRVWGDERVRRLTPPPPCGLHLWIWFLACPRSILIPGLIPEGRRALAESIRWPQEGFDKAFAEVAREGLAVADWNAPLVWLPNAIRYNPPQSPNVVSAWRHPWDELPECKLKTVAWEALCTHVGDIGKGFAEAFARACPNPSGKPSSKSLANQEQEQDQDQKQEEAPRSSAPALPTSDLERFVSSTWDDVTLPLPEDRWREAFPAVDLLAEARKAAAWEASQPAAKRKRDHRAFLGRWFGRAQEDAARAPVSAPSPSPTPAYHRPFPKENAT